MCHLNNKILFIFFVLISVLGTYYSLSNFNQKENLSISEVNPGVVIEGAIEPFCNGIDYLTYSEIEFGAVSLLDIEILDREGWYTNLFELSLEETGGIDPKYKDKFQAKLTVKFKNKQECTFFAVIRISGDKKDHINSDLMASLDVKLLNGNIFGITKFKLFLPGTRNHDNEIVVTTLLEESGFISPRSFYVNVGTLNWSNQFTINKYIFQEKQSKEMIEHNSFREGPLIETNESFYWDFMGVNTKDPNITEPLFIARIVNSYWSKRNINSSKISVEAVENYNKAIFNSYLPSRQINYGYLGTDQNLFYKFDAANFALLNDHAITTHQRKFFFDKLNNQFHPIYYDGNSNFIELGHIRWRQDYLEYQKLYKAAGLLLKNLNIDNKIFNKKLNNRGLEMNVIESDELINKYKNNLKFISELSTDLIPEYIDFDSNNKKIYYEENFNFLFYDFEKNEYELCDSKLVDCKLFRESIDVEEVFSRNVNVGTESSLLLGKSRESFRNTQPETTKVIEFDKDIFIRYFGIPEINIDNQKKEIIFEFNSLYDRIVLEGSGVLEDWKITLFSNHVVSNNSLTYDENLLTGCLTINNLNIQNLSLIASNLYCEDSINVISSKGHIQYVNIENSDFDGLDLDFSKIEIEELEIENSSNDCLDVSSGNYKIKNANLASCYDKGLSVGENSLLSIDQIEIKESLIAMAVKDSSNVKINYFKSSNNNFCLQQYRKKQEFGPSYVKITNYECDSETVVQKGSVFESG